MTTKWTPGPWRVGDAGHTIFGPPNGNPSPETIANVRNRVNSTVLAAAPELVNMLKSIIVMLPEPMKSHNVTVQEARALLQRIEE